MNCPIPILFTIPNFITAGSGQVMFNILSRLDRERFAPAVCVSKRGGRLDQAVEDLNIPFIEAPFTVAIKPYPGLLRRARQAAQVFRPNKFAIWHSFHYSSDYSEVLIARFSGARAWVYTKKNMSWGSRAWIMRSLLATRIVADNAEMLKLFFNRFGLHKKVHLIHHGISLDQFYPRNVKNGVYHLQLKIAPETSLIGCVAHLVPVKGHPTLIAALAELENTHLLLAGSTTDTAYIEQLHRQVSELGLQERVHLLGNVSDIPSLLAEVEIAVLPTWDRWRKEGCPVALLEAMACGKACVATDIPGARDIIEPGVSGLLVPPEDSHALAAALHALIQDPELRARLGKAARRRVVEHFSIEREVVAHEALYTEIAVAKGLWQAPG